MCAAYHMIFLLDISGSMSSPDLIPTTNPAFKDTMKNRLGCSLESFVRLIEELREVSPWSTESLILFGSSATVRFEGKPVTEDLTPLLTTIGTSGSTNCTAGLEEAERMLKKHSAPGSPANFIILLSDGAPDNSRSSIDVATRIKAQAGEAFKLFTIMFSQPDPGAVTFLRNVASSQQTAFMAANPVELLHAFNSIRGSLNHI